MSPCPGLSHNIPNHFTDEKTEAQTEVSRLELKVKLWNPSALKFGTLRIPEPWKGVHLNLRLGTTLSRMGEDDNSH